MSRKVEIPITRRLMAGEDRETDVNTGTLWKYVSPTRISTLLQRPPGECAIVKQLGLCSTFEINYTRPDSGMVREYIENFDFEKGRSRFRGHYLPFNTEVLRTAFKLPQGDPEEKRSRWMDPNVKHFFARDKERGGKYCIDWLKKDYKHWEGPLRVVSELLLGRRRPSSCTGKMIWYFFCYLGDDVRKVEHLIKRPDELPDWAQLMHDDMGAEINLVRTHLIKGKVANKKAVSCYLGTAIMHILEHFGHKTPILNQCSKEITGISDRIRKRQRRDYVEIESSEEIAEPVARAPKRTRRDYVDDLSSEEIAQPVAKRPKRACVIETEKKMKAAQVAAKRNPSTTGTSSEEGFSERDAMDSYNLTGKGLSSEDALDSGTSTGKGLSFQDARDNWGKQEGLTEAREVIQPATHSNIAMDGAEVRNITGSTEERDTIGHFADECRLQSAGAANEADGVEIHDEDGIILEVNLENAAEQYFASPDDYGKGATEARGNLGDEVPNRGESVPSDLRCRLGEERDVDNYADTHSRKSLANDFEEFRNKLLVMEEKILSGESLWKEEISKKDRTIVFLRSEIKEILKEEDEHKSQVVALRVENKKLQSSLTEQCMDRDRLLQNSTNEMIRLLCAKDTAESQVADLKIVKEELQEAKDTAESQLADLKIVKEELQEAKDTAESQLAGLKIVKEELQEAKDTAESQLAGLRLQKEELQEAKHFADSEVARLKILNHELQEAKDSAETHVAVLKIVNANLLEKTDMANEEMQTLRTMKERFIEDRNKLQLEQEQVDRMRRDTEKVKQMTISHSQLLGAIAKQLREQAVSFNNEARRRLETVKSWVREKQDDIELLKTQLGCESSKLRISEQQVLILQGEMEESRKESSLHLTQGNFHAQTSSPKMVFTTSQQSDLQAGKKDGLQMGVSVGGSQDATEKENIISADKISGYEGECQLKYSPQIGCPSSDLRSRSWQEIPEMDMGPTPGQSPITGISTADNTRPEDGTGIEGTLNSKSQPLNRWMSPELPEGSEDSDDRFWSKWRNIPVVPEPPVKVMDGSDLVDEAEAPPGLLLCEIKEHQKKGLAWMLKRESPQSCSPRGGILADEQGMGKTIQAISLFLSDRPNASCTLVVCPTAVMAQWIEEIATKCSPIANMRSLCYHGPKRNSPVRSNFEDYSVVVTSYRTLQIEWENHNGRDKAGHMIKSPLYTMQWTRVVLDECQYIKNSKSKISNAVCDIKSTNRWCVTGTPLQNTVDDTYSFFRFLRYDKLERKLSFKFLKKRCQKNYMAGMADLKRHLSYMTLRRTKESLGLPKKHLNEVRIDFAEDSHRSLYESIVEKSSELWTETKNAGCVKTGKALALLMKSRQVCVHPALANGKKMTMKDLKQTSTVRDLKEMQEILFSLNMESKCQGCQQEELMDGFFIAEACKHVMCNRCSNENFAGFESFQCPAAKCNKIGRLFSFDDIILDMEICGEKPFSDCSSSKVECVMEYIRKLPPLNRTRNRSEAASTEKVIVFSQWTSALDLLQKRFQMDSIEYERVDGSMATTSRQTALRRFSNEPKKTVLLLSLMAGNAGLNIVAANHVVLLDSWWNPTVEDQAIDRVHRIGQVRPVTVTRFIVKYTIEERVLILQDRKRKLCDSVFSSEIKEPPKIKKSKKMQKQGDIDFLIG